METIEWDILGIALMNWTGKGEINNGEVIWHSDEPLATVGVSFLLSKCAMQSLIG